MRIKNIRCIFNLLGTVGYINNHSINFNNYSFNFESSSTMGFAFYNKRIYSFDISNGNVYLIEVDKNNIISTNCGTTLMKFPLGENIFYEKESIGAQKTKLIFYNFKSEIVNEIVITNLDRSYHFFPYFASITNDYQEFILFNYLEKLPKWTFSAKHLGTYTDYTGIHEGKIKGEVFKCRNTIISELSSPQLVGTNVKFVGLDIESGNLLWVKEFPLDFYTRLVNYKDELLVLGEYLWKMDPTTGELLERYIPFFEMVGRYHNFLITDDYIFTYTLKTEIKQLSRKTGVILWSDTLYGDKEAGRRGKTINGNDPIQYADGKLYVLDSEKVLHVLDVANDK